MGRFRSDYDKACTFQAVVGVCFIAVMLALFVGIPAFKASGGWNYEYSEGTRSGVVQKFSKKGAMWKTWEGELNLGYAQSKSNGDGGTSIVPEIWYFSAIDDDVAKRILDAEKTGRRVTLHYKQLLLAGFDKGSTGYVVTDVSVETGF